MNCMVCLSEIKKKGKYDFYHNACLRRVFGTIKADPASPFTRKEFKTERAKRSNRKFSISGVQPKLLVSIKENGLEDTEVGGTHILKISPEEYPYCAENEHLTMEIFRFLKLDTALCSLVKLKDGEFAYITKRFDREKFGEEKIHQEDMMQAMGISAEENSKYDNRSYEDVAIFLYQTAKNLVVVGDFFKRVVLNFLLGNGDFHLKNISIRPTYVSNKQNCLTPVYDAVNTEVYELGDSELAMNLVNTEMGTTKHFDYDGYHTRLCFDEFAERIGLNTKFTNSFYQDYQKSFDDILRLVQNSFLPYDMKEKYKNSLNERMKKMFAPDR